MLNSYGEPRPNRTPTPPVSLMERPDHALVRIHAEVQTETASAAVPLLRRAVQRFEELLPQVGATLTLEAFEFAHGSGKVSNGGGFQLKATVRVPLAKDASFWDRAQRLAQLDDLLRAVVLEGKKQKPMLEVRRDLPVFLVADPEAHRAALITRLHARAKSLAGGGAVHLKELRFERAVIQESLGAERVELSLAVDGVVECLLP